MDYSLHRRVFALAIFFVTALAAFAPEPVHGLGQRCELTADTETQLRQSIEFSRVMRMDRPLPGVLSPNGAYQFWLLSEGAGQETLAESLIDIDSERSDLQRISIPGISGAIDARWVNEKLLFAQWRWPQNISAQLLLDVESGEAVSLVFSCDK